MLNNGIIKGVMFLSAGNIHHAYDSSTSGTVGALRRIRGPALFLVGFFAVTGSPPFGVVSSCPFSMPHGAASLRRRGSHAGPAPRRVHGDGCTVLGVVQGEAGPSSSPSRFRDGILNTLPALVLLAMSFGMGVAMPDAIQSMVREAADYVGGRR